MKTPNLIITLALLGLILGCAKDEPLKIPEIPEDENNAIVCDINEYLGDIGCHLTTTCLVPITDMGTDTYLGFQGGLYDKGSNLRPSAHTQKGMDIANSIIPLNELGNPDSVNGKIVMASVGLSNSNFEFNEYLKLVAVDQSKNPLLTVVNSAIPGYSITDWIPETNVKDPSAWDIVHDQYNSLDVSQEQVQVIWLKHTTRNSAFLGGFEKQIDTLTYLYKKLIPILMEEFPNLKMAYMSSRTRAYSFDPATTDPEPYAYGSGFAVRNIVMGQINEEADLNYDSQKGIVNAPWISWGPYLWANGEPRDDGFVWNCEDTKGDFMHPSNDFGSPKVAQKLYDFFTTDETSTKWYFD